MEEHVDGHDLRIIEETKSDIALNLLKAGIPRRLIIKNCGVSERWLRETERG
ncbi:MAG: hypothetical protein LBW85_06935 [Deltaproteobacteria bacterium]|jgi:hypothetical protein|nr:hypothetical protein [Deltaproteobacteria bacterium]